MLDARPAGDALFFIDAGDARVSHADGAVAAAARARLFADAPDGACLDAARDQLAGGAVAVALIVVFIQAGMAAAAVHDGDGVFSRVAAAQDGGDLFFIGGGGGAAVGELCLPFDQRLGELGAARPAAAAAIGLRQQLFHRLGALVFFDGEEVRGDDEDGAEDERDGEHDAARQQNLYDLFCHGNTCNSICDAVRKPDTVLRDGYGPPVPDA